MRIVLASSPESTSLDKLTEMADKTAMIGKATPSIPNEEGTGSPHGLSALHSDPDIVYRHNWSNVKAATGLDQCQPATTAGGWFLV